jgi:hypothetical protein
MEWLQVAEHLPSKCKVPSSNPSTANNQTHKENQKPNKQNPIILASQVIIGNAI